MHVQLIKCKNSIKDIPNHTTDQIVSAMIQDGCSDKIIFNITKLKLEDIKKIRRELWLKKN